MLLTDFTQGGDTALEEAFLKDGYVIVPVENHGGLDAIRKLIANTAGDKVGQPVGDDPGALLNNIHQYVGVDDLNALRLAVIGALRGSAWFRPTYYSLAREAIATLVGNELAMQRGIGLSVQMPNDTSSLLPIHADVWDGDSPFEVVAWLPMVDCFESKSMYIVPPSINTPFQESMHRHQAGSAEDLFKAIEKDAIFLNVPYGSVLLFSQTLMHGNRLNVVEETRWSMNCRFKSLMSPFADKKLGEFFEPITTRPTTRMGMQYKMPEGFHE